VTDIRKSNAKQIGRIFRVCDLAELPQVYNYFTLSK